MQPKLADVAREAGVSPTTVSRVINNKAHLSEKTKKWIIFSAKIECMVCSSAKTED